MKRLILVGLLFAVPALAQETGPPGLRAWKLLYEREVMAHQNDLGAVFTLQDQAATLNAQIASLTKERDALKAKYEPPAPEKAP